jgi:polyphosphate kinase
MMPRNLDRRVEVVFPVEDPTLVHFIHDEVLAVYLADVVKARHMMSDGSYDRPADRNKPGALNCQEWFIKKFTVSQQPGESALEEPTHPAHNGY